MKAASLVVILVLCLYNPTGWAQKYATKKAGLFSYSASLSDYNFVQRAKDSSLGYAFKQNDLFKSGNTSFGIMVSYWKGLNSHIDLSGNLGGTFSNFPALFVKDDSVGQANFSTHLDVLLHFRALKENARINPFLTAGIGAGYFVNKPAVYAPVGTGLQFRFKEGPFVFIQAQWRIVLSSGINNDYMFYSVGFAQPGKLNSKEKKQKTKMEIPTKGTVKKEIPVADADSDGDGVADSKDSCPTEKGNVYGCPDSDGDGIADKEEKWKVVAGVYRYDGCPVPDTDDDGLNDEIDKCKTEAGPGENHGCPWPDADGDGVLDKEDKCPYVKGLAENNGCPLPVANGAEIIFVSEDSMTYRINFDFDRAILLPDAFAVLKRIVDILKADNSLSINITGHADNMGTDAGNIRVSAERAKISRDYFLSYNIAAARIKYSWYGASRPIDHTQQWRNRRVEITIIKN
jgi:outer membrane protein OmpA-like peptidoglycan-associated protein